MIFSIEYHRSQGRILTLTTFKDSERGKAENARLEKELDLMRNGLNYEVVLLEAASEEALRKTHRRYFENPSQILNSTSGSNIK
jgi:hypothetical protein